MNILILLILISLLMAAGFVGAFIWAIKNGQYDDSFTPSVRILWEEEARSEKSKQSASKSKQS